jgi:hypothetical protein
MQNLAIILVRMKLVPQKFPSSDTNFGQSEMPPPRPPNNTSHVEPGPAIQGVSQKLPKSNPQMEPVTPGNTTVIYIFWYSD